MIYNEETDKADLVKFNEETIMGGTDFSFEKSGEKNRIIIRKVKTCQALTIRMK